VARAHGPWRLDELAKAVGGDLRGDPERLIERPVPAGSADAKGITFAESEKYLKRALSVPVGAVLVPEAAPTLDVPAIACQSPRQAFFVILGMAYREEPIISGVHEAATVEEGAELGADVCVGAGAYVASGATIGAGTSVYPGAYIGEGVSIGKDCQVMPNAVVQHDVTVGDRCVLGAGSVVGRDGFGFVFDGEKQVRVPQSGVVVLEDDVEIGANTCIDRATCGQTIIRKGVKLDNLIQIAHNCEVGANTVIASQTGVSGSAKIGERCVIGGQVGVGDHAELGDQAIVGSQAGVLKKLGEGAVVWGTPAIPHQESLKLYALYRKMPELMARIKALEEELERRKDD
jgi:UDP-3-O-[3-hydroxymyristoyl] glucosamine N-acyltransferase